MAKTLKKGIFITLDGPEGCGKSTQSKRLGAELKSEGYDVILTQEPGDTMLGKLIREILLQKKGFDISPEAELFLFESDRAQHVREVIMPALMDGKIVICDRFNTATFAYQGYGLGMDMKAIKKIDEFSCGGVKPDLTVILDIDARSGLCRAGKVREADKIEERGEAFHGRVRKGYLSIARASKGAIKVIDASRTPGQVYEDVKKEAYAVVKRYSRTK